MKKITENKLLNIISDSIFTDENTDIIQDVLLFEDHSLPTGEKGILIHTTDGTEYYLTIKKK